MLAQTDLRAAAKALQGVPRAADDDVRWERWASALVAYGRPFKNATLRLPAEWSHFADPDLQRLHDELVTWRDKLFAHNDAMLQRRVLLIPPNGAREERHAFDSQKAFGPKRVIAAQLQRIDARIEAIAAELCHGQGWEEGKAIALTDLPKNITIVPPPKPFRAPKSERGEPLER